MIEETDGLVIAEKVDHLAPIKETVGQVGIEMPDMVATGDLHVDYKVKDDEQTKDVDQKKIPLPEMGTKFMLWGNEYKVIYINEGKHRFSCEPCKGVY